MWGVYPDLGDPERVYQDLIHLTELEFTVPDSAELEQTYRFAHVITHEVIYQSLPHMVRTALHEQIGRFIEESYPTQLGQHLDRLAFHYAASDHTAKACEYLRRAGEAAQASYANEAAADTTGVRCRCCPPTTG